MTAQTVLPLAAPSHHRRKAVMASAATALALAAGVVSVNGVADAAVRDTSVKATVVVNQTSPALGDYITFKVSYGSSKLRTPVVAAACFQNGVRVWAYNAGPNDSVKLGSDWSPWQQAGGAANCTLTLQDMSWSGGKQTVTVYATSSFDARG